MAGKIRIICAVTAAFAVVTVLSGCNSADPARDGSYAANAVIDDESIRLAKEDYRTRLLDTFTEWSGENTYIALALSREEGHDIAEIPDRAEKANAALDGFNDFLPPREFDKLHNNILLNIDIERKWLAAAVKAAEADKAGDTAGFDAAVAEVEKYGTGSKFPVACLEILKALKE